MVSSDSLETRPEHLRIFVNRRPFDSGDGVRPEMTGADIAKLVDVPPENAIVREQVGDELRDVGVESEIHVKNGEHFIVTRKIVEGGHERRAY